MEEIGSILSFAGSTIPDNYLVCDGAAVSRTDYADLYSVIGDRYGSGDGSTTFNVPNLSGLTTLGTDATYALGAVGGEAEHQLLVSEIASHVHEVPQHGHGNNIVAKTPSLAHTITQPVEKYTGVSGTNTDCQSGSRNTYNGRTSTAMTKTANLTVADHAATACTMSGAVTAHDAFATDSAGDGSAHNNMMPYMALTYIIRALPDLPPGERMVLFNGALPVSASGAYICGKGV